jgi:protein-export membrane protein SecD
MSNRYVAAAIVLIGAFFGWYAFSGGQAGYVRGLDLAGGVHITYKVDVTNVPPQEIPERMVALREAIERRINVFGVSEPLVQSEVGRGENGVDEHRVIVELPGYSDVDEAVARIGKTPALEFKLMLPATTTVVVATTSTSTLDTQFVFLTTGLDGARVARATLQFDPTTNAPVVALKFDEQGTKLFADLTTNNVGKPVAIFLDGNLISSPIVNEPIPSGEAVISGGGPGFRVEEARELVRDINFGALPFKIEVAQTQTIGPSLGEETWIDSATAFAVTVIAVMLYMIVYYRKLGFLAAFSLALYAIMLLATFKWLPVTLTASGIAGLVLSLGMAVDANVLVFERIQDELKRGATRREALEHGFSRAWPSIRDGNLTSLISAFILYWMSGASLVKGFALVYGLGILASFFANYIASRAILRLFVPEDAPQSATTKTK